MRCVVKKATNALHNDILCLWRCWTLLGLRQFLVSCDMTMSHSQVHSRWVVICSIRKYTSVLSAFITIALSTIAFVLCNIRLNLFGVLVRILLCSDWQRVAWWLSGRALDLRFTGRWFNSRPVRFPVTYVNSALHPSGVAKSSTCFGWG